MQQQLQSQLQSQKTKMNSPLPQFLKKQNNLQKQQQQQQSQFLINQAQPQSQQQNTKPFDALIEQQRLSHLKADQLYQEQAEDRISAGTINNTAGAPTATKVGLNIVYNHNLPNSKDKTFKAIAPSPIQGSTCRNSLSSNLNSSSNVNGYQIKNHSNSVYQNSIVSQINFNNSVQQTKTINNNQFTGKSRQSPNQTNIKNYMKIYQGKQSNKSMSQQRQKYNNSAGSASNNQKNAVAMHQNSQKNFKQALADGERIVSSDDQDKNLILEVHIKRPSNRQLPSRNKKESQNNKINNVNKSSGKTNNNNNGYGFYQDAIKFQQLKASQYQARERSRLANYQRTNARQSSTILAGGNVAAPVFHQTLQKKFSQLNSYGRRAIPTYYENQQKQYSVSDAVIDSEDDGFDFNDFDADSIEYQATDINDEFSSPRAAKPLPIDQILGGVQAGQKYFSVTIGYPAVRSALRARGWIEVSSYKKTQQIAGYTSSPGTKGVNLGLESAISKQSDQVLDLKFVLSGADANHSHLQKGCLINQNRGEGHLTCKSGLSDSLMRSWRSMACWYPMEHCDPFSVGPESFFPRSHMINSVEALQEFQRDFVQTAAENHLRKFIKKLKEFKEKGGKLCSPSHTRVQTLSAQKRSSPSKNRQSMKTKLSMAQLSSAEDSPGKEMTTDSAADYDRRDSIALTTIQDNTGATLSYSLQGLGFLKEKLLICCHVVQKRVKSLEHKLDTKKGIRADRVSVGSISVEERSFLLRNPKTISQAYLKYVQKGEWYTKAVGRFPQFKKDKSLSAQSQQSALCDKIAETCTELIEKLRPAYPQTDLNGMSNLWIVKPSGLSRGRRIRLFKDFTKIIEYAEVDPTQQLSAAAGPTGQGNTSGASNAQYYMNHLKPVIGEDTSAGPKTTWVIQKYIENPMLIMNRKLDLRMWVVIPTWNPLRIYIYKECYVRFSCNDYDPRCPENLFSHLTNNSVAKKCIERPDNAKALKKIPGNMWSLAQFQDYLGARSRKNHKVLKRADQQQEVTKDSSGQANDATTTALPETSTIRASLPADRTEVTDDLSDEDHPNNAKIGEEIWNTKYYPQAKEIVVQSIISAWDKIEWRKGGVGIYGFDLFPDANGKLWLLEINKCPTMEYSTQVTKNLVPRFLEDLVELIVEKRHGDHPEVAGFERVFEVPQLRERSDYQQTIKDLKVEGKGIAGLSNPSQQKFLQQRNTKKRKAGKYNHNY